MGGRSVFISYRRQLSWELARLVSNDLIEHNFDTFIDLQNLDSGEFERTILRQIRAREHFIVLLEPGSLDRIGEDGDWLRREIAYALARDRNVVPLTANGFQFRRGLELPPDVARLPSFNAVPITSHYFKEAMERLRTRFLKTPSRPGLKLPSDLRASPSRPAPQLGGRVKDQVQIQLTWSEVSGADEYVLEKSLSGTKESFRQVYGGPDRSYNGPEDFPELCRYRVRASASGQAGKWSAVWRPPLSRIPYGPRRLSE